MGGMLIGLSGVPSGQAIAQSHAPTIGTEFWLGFMQNFSEGPQALQVFVSSQRDTEGAISIPGMGWSEDFSVVANKTTVLDVPFIAEHSTSGVVEGKGVVVTTKDTVSVFAVNFREVSADGTLVYPVQTIGTSYRVQAYRGFQLNTQHTYPSQILIVATQDGTEVEVVPSASTQGGGIEGQPFVVQLDAGQSYQIKAASGAADLTGTSVVGTAASGSCRPFAVFSGVPCARVPASCTACDHLFHQNLPSTSWGSRYFLVPFQSLATYTYRILSDRSGTRVRIDGTTSVELDAGRFLEFNGVGRPMYVEGDVPFNVTQYMEGEQCAGNGDPAMLVLSADDQKIKDVTFATMESNVIDQHFLNIIVDAADADQVRLDGGGLDPGLFSPFLNYPSVVYARVAISEGSHRLECPNGLAAYVYGTGVWETYAYPVGAFAAMPQFENISAECGTGPEAATTLSVPRPLLDPYWALWGRLDDTLHVGAEYSFIPWGDHIYVLRGTDPMSGCEQWVLFDVQMREPLQVALTAGTSECAGQAVPIQATVSPGNSGHVYRWVPEEYLSDPGIAAPIAFPPRTTWYHLSVVSEDGCSMVRDSVLVAVQDTVLGYLDAEDIPNVFTPNGDGVNDRFPLLKDIQGETHLTVYDRWGLVVFSSFQGGQWDGTDRSGSVLPEGVYYYVLEYTPTCPAGVEETLYAKGYVQLLR